MDELSKLSMTELIGSYPNQATWIFNIARGLFFMSRLSADCLRKLFYSSNTLMGRIGFYCFLIQNSFQLVVMKV